MGARGGAYIIDKMFIILFLFQYISITSSTYIFLRGLGGSGTSLTSKIFTNQHEDITGSFKGGGIPNCFCIFVCLRLSF